jgi:colicin import membrane protein
MPVVENSKNQEVINAMVMESLPMPSKTIQKPSVPDVIPKPAPPVKTTELIKPIQKAPDMPVKKPAIAISHKTALAKPVITQPILKKVNVAKKEKAIQNAFEKEIQEIKAKSLQQQLQQEQKRIAATMTQQTHGIVDKYKALILQTISQHWIVPGNADKHLTAELLIRVAPGGLVLDVQIIKGSGDAALDRSARAAVFNASPLPVPTDATAFTSFRQFVLKVKPENVLRGDSWMS